MTTIQRYADLLSSNTVRSQCARVTAHVRDGSGLFDVNDAALEACAEHVVDVTRRRYPTLEIPYHSRWRHFSATGATALATRLEEVLSDHDSIEAARLGFDLVIPSVLLDAGAGPDWAYLAPESEAAIGRSEGLGLASLGMFLGGALSDSGEATTDARALSALTEEQLKSGFQVDASNPLVGIDGRLAILQRLGHVMIARPEVFPSGRPGNLVDRLLVGGETVTASSILAVVLDVLAPIWPPRLVRYGISLGDSWEYKPFGDGPSSIVPFHKLSQWLTYSLAETLERNGIEVVDLAQLTGLPEYRNGGLLYETGVLSLHDSDLAELSHLPDSQLIVEWRALTITLLDELADIVRAKLGRPDLLLAEILECGTWAAGRELAFARTSSGTPPLHLESDGTVF
jgi:hypothetical protein